MYYYVVQNSGGGGGGHIGRGAGKSQLNLAGPQLLQQKRRPWIRGHGFGQSHGHGSTATALKVMAVSDGDSFDQSCGRELGSHSSEGSAGRAVGVTQSYSFESSGRELTAVTLAKAMALSARPWLLGESCGCG